MSPSANVDRWLDGAASNQPKEAYESDSGAESSTSAQARARKSNDAPIGSGPGSDDDGGAKDIDWAEVIGKVRSAVLDQSPKRRQLFFQRYLTVSTTCGGIPFPYGSRAESYSTTSKRSYGPRDWAPCRPAILHSVPSRRSCGKDSGRLSQSGQCAERRWAEAGAEIGQMGECRSDQSN